MKCPHCKGENQNEAKVCENCNRELHSSQFPEKDASASVPKTSGKAIASLVCSIVGIFVCLFIGQVLGIAFGEKAKEEIRESQGSLKGEGLAKAGIIVGWVGIAIDIIIIVGSILLAVFLPRLGYDSFWASFLDEDMLERYREVNLQSELGMVRTAETLYYGRTYEMPQSLEDLIKKEKLEADYGFSKEISGETVTEDDLCFEGERVIINRPDIIDSEGESIDSW